MAERSMRSVKAIVVLVVLALSSSQPRAQELSGAELDEVMAAHPDLLAIRNAVERIAAVASVCHAAACVKTDCAASYNAQDQLWIASEHLRAMSGWTDKARQGGLIHFNQLMNESIRKGDRQAFLENL